MLGNQAHQCDQADLRIHIERAARPLEGQQRADHRQGHRQHDHQRIDKTLELRRQHQKNEQERQGKHNRQRALRFFELARGAVQVRAVAGFKHLGGRTVQKIERLTQRVVSRQIGRDGDRAALAEMVEFSRSDRLAHFDQRGQRNHGVIAPAHKYFLDIIGRVTATARRLHNHVKLITIALVTRHLPSPQHGFNGARHHVNADAQVGGLFTVHFDFEFRLVQSQVNIGTHDAGVFRHFVHELPRDSGQVLVAFRGHDHKVDRPLPKALPQRGRRDRKRIDTGQGGQLGLQLSRNVEHRALALVPIHRPHDHAGLRHGGVAGRDKNTVKLLVGLPKALDGADITIGIGQCGTIRCRH